MILESFRVLKVVVQRDTVLPGLKAVILDGLWVLK
jgi:hypothetical protein